jgi:hypothetical protein
MRDVKPGEAEESSNGSSNTNATRKKPGRKPLGKETREVFSFRLEPTTADYLKELGDGSLGVGIETVAAFYQQEMARRTRVWLPFGERPKTTVLAIEEDGDTV